MTDKTQPTAHAEITAPISADLRRIEREAQELPEPSATAGMNLGQRILHVGGRENAAGYIEFGSVAAVRALVSQVLRDLPSQAAAKCLHQGADAAAVAALKGLLSLVRREAPQLSGKVLGDAESAIAALQAAPPAPAVAVPDDFRGDTATLVRNIIALLELDAEGALVPHGVGGHARGLLSAAAARLAAAPAQAAPESHTQALEAIATWPVTDMLMNMDAANMRGIAQRALAAPAQEHATQLAGQGLEASVTCALDEAKNNRCKCGAGTLMDCLSENCDVVRARAAAPVQAQEDARDAARLDYLQEQGATVELVFGGEGCSFRFRVGGLYAAAHQDLRDAIDAAMAAGGAT